MNRIVTISLVMMTIVLSSCIKDFKRVEGEPYEKIYRIEQLDVRFGVTEIAINPIVSTYDESFDAESRAFYNSIDSSLTYTGKVYVRPFNGGYRPIFSAIDWRLCQIDVIALEDFNDAHLSGSLLNDLIEIRYYYKHSFIRRPLSELTYGVLMMTDYLDVDNIYGDLHLVMYPEPRTQHKEYHETTIVRDNIYEGVVNFPAIEIRITDAFGREFVKQYDPKIDEPTL